MQCYTSWPETGWPGPGRWLLAEHTKDLSICMVTNSLLYVNKEIISSSLCKYDRQGPRAEKKGPVNRELNVLTGNMLEGNKLLEPHDIDKLGNLHIKTS